MDAGWYGKHKHSLMMVLCCAIPLIVIFGVASFFGPGRGYLYWFILLLCPLMHFFMMRNVKDEHRH